MSEIPIQKPRILIVDDEAPIRDLLMQMLSDDYTCITAASAEAALRECENSTFSVVVSDVNLGGMSGVEMAPRILTDFPDTVVMMISGASSLDTAIDALRVGVFDYVRKPFDFDQVMSATQKAVAHHFELVAKRTRETDLETLVEEKSAELQYLTQHDVLTDMPNRRMFEDQLRGMVMGESDPRKRLGVLLLGVSNLRSVRDSLGHDTANSIVLEISQRIRTLDNERSVARLDGDRFALLLSPTDLEKAVEASDRVVDVLGPTFSVDGHDIYLNVNIGISIFPDDGSDYRDLLRNAGAALSQAESEGIGRSQFYSAEMNVNAVRRLTLENNLRRALERDELAVFYQPKIDTVSKRVMGMEALLRWNSAELGPVFPDVFIPIAESTELIIPIGEWVLRTACDQTKAWHDAGFPLHVAVNLSACQFRDNRLLSKIQNVVEESGLDPTFLNLEVTESSIVTDPAAAIKILSELQKLGVGISIDDFGTGHSSFGYLRTLPVDVLKIDRSFVATMTTDMPAGVLVRTIITLAHDLRLSVVAEGVETEDQLNALTEMECDEWQGYLHSKAVPHDEFDQKLRAGWKV